MTATVRPILRCEDGTEIPFEWVYDDAPQYEWMRDRAHWPRPLTHLELAIRTGSTAGADRAWREVDMEPLHPFRRFQFAGPFMYARLTPYEPERVAAIGRRYAEVAHEYGGIQAFWDQYCEPRIRGAIDEIAAMPAGAPLRTAGETWQYGFHQTFTSAAMLSEAQMRLTMLLAEHTGADAMLIAYETTQGGDNASQAIDSEIAALTDLARVSSAAQVIAREGDGALAALRADPAAAAFVAAFDALIAEHSMRSLGWACTMPTWGERPEAALALVRAELAAPAVTQEEMHAKSAASRAAATAGVLATLPAEKHASFHAIVRELDGYVGIREGRAYWQMVITGAMRLFLLRTGAALVDAGRIADAEDVFYLMPDEIERASAAMHDTVAQRRTEWERWNALKTPLFIGTPGPFAAMAEEARAAWRGSPASRGTVTGTARILRGPEEGARLGKGEILVCEMTTPAWTPLFAIAGGIVTETGGALSHPAITAREYGIPAVVALDGAMTKIKDGQTITINGGTGEVTLDG